MAVTKATDWKIYNEEVQTGFAETVTQRIKGIAEGSRGAIVIKDAMFRGDYIKNAFFKLPASLVTRRITTATGYNSAVTPVTVAQGEEAQVRLSRKLGPVDITLDSLRRAGITPDGASVAIGSMLADAVLQKQLNDALGSCAAALLKTASTEDRTGLTVKTMNRDCLVDGMAKMGDMQQEIVCWIMHSKPYGNLVAEAATTASFDSISASVAIYGAQAPALGRPVVVTDSSNLVLDETADKYYTLGLTAGAIQIIADTVLAEVYSEIVTGLENLCLRIQGERDYAVGIKGYTWDTGNGGANPLDAALITGTNWDLVASSFKLGAGIVIKTT
jgi:hypothetical protein